MSTYVYGSDISFVHQLPYAYEAQGDDNTLAFGSPYAYEAQGDDMTFKTRAAVSGDIHIDQLKYQHSERMEV